MKLGDFFLSLKCNNFDVINQLIFNSFLKCTYLKYT